MYCRRQSALQWTCVAQYARIVRHWRVLYSRQTRTHYSRVSRAPGRWRRRARRGSGTTGPLPGAVLGEREPACDRVEGLRGVGVTGCGSAVGSAARNAVAIDRTLKPELGTRAKQRGVEWAITLDITPDELVAVIYDAASGLLEQSNVAQE